MTKLRETKSIAFSNVKGGVGKSMSVFMLSGYLSEKGYKVLCIDADPQHNLTDAFLNTEPVNNLTKLLSGDCDITDVIVKPYLKNKKLKNTFFANLFFCHIINKFLFIFFIL